MKKAIIMVGAIGSLTCIISSADATYFLVNGHHRFIVEASAGRQYSQLSNLSAGATQVGTSNSLAAVNRPSVSSLGYDFKFGYRLHDPSASPLSSLFSEDSILELAFGHQGGEAHFSSANLGEGFLWYIDGSGKIEGYLPGPAQQWDVKNVQLQNKFQQNQFRLSLKKGSSYSGDPLGVVFQPSVGVIYIHSKIEANSFIDYIGEDMPTHETDSIRNRIDTRYWGAGLGEKVEWRSSSNWTPYADAELFLLRSNTLLSASQDPMINPPPTRTPKFVREDASRMTYRVLLVLGVTYRWSHDPNAIRIALQAGLEHWGYRPGVAMPTQNGEKVHLIANAATDKFLGLVLRIPLG